MWALYKGIIWKKTKKKEKKKKKISYSMIFAVFSDFNKSS